VKLGDKFLLLGRCIPHHVSLCRALGGQSVRSYRGAITVAPREVPRATGRLRQFLRASFDQHERIVVPVEEELAVVRAHLEIESLRLGDRLKVEQTIDLGLLKVLIPPFSFQPLVENAIQHGLRSSPQAARLRLAVRPAGEWLELSLALAMTVKACPPGKSNNVSLENARGSL
jgi:LytS/YehU family sensor histidine kinase